MFNQIRKRWKTKTVKIHWMQLSILKLNIADKSIKHSSAHFSKHSSAYNTLLDSRPRLLLQILNITNIKIIRLKQNIAEKNK